jgi:uncharacterized protein (TIGR00106 family)
MIVEFSIVPIGKQEELAAAVAAMLDIVDRSGLSYQLTSMGTIVEGEWDDIFALIKECHGRMRKTSRRVSTHISVDDREGARGRLTGKVEAVEQALGRTLKT